MVNKIVNLHQDKEVIYNNFNRAAESYDDVAFVQKKCAQILVSQLIKYYGHYASPRSILDVGTGTGYIPSMLLKYFPGSNYTLNDISPKMLDFNKTKFKSQKKFYYHLGDMELSNFPFHDIVTSNFAMQWTDNILGTIDKLYRQTNTMAFSCLLNNTFKEWYNLLENSHIKYNIMEYPTQNQVEKLISSFTNTKFSLTNQVVKITFSSVRSFIKYLKFLGARGKGQNITYQGIKKLIDNAGSLSITYDVLFVIMGKI